MDGKNDMVISAFSSRDIRWIMWPEHVAIIESACKTEGSSTRGNNISSFVKREKIPYTLAYIDLRNLSFSQLCS